MSSKGRGRSVPPRRASRSSASTSCAVMRMRLALGADAALQDVSHAELPGRLADVDGAALVDEAGIAGDDAQPGQLRQRGDDVLDQAVGEEVPAPGRPTGWRTAGPRWRGFRRAPASPFRCLRRRAIAAPAPGPDRCLDILERQIRRRRMKATPTLPLTWACTASGHQNAAPWRLRFQPGRHIDAIAENVVSVDDDVAEIDADAKFDGLTVGPRRVVVGHRRLNGERAFHRIHGAGKLDQRAVAHHLDDAAAVFGHGRIEARGPDVAQRRERSRLVGAHQPRIADNIGREDRREASRGSFVDHRPCSRRPGPREKGGGEPDLSRSRRASSHPAEVDVAGVPARALDGALARVEPPRTGRLVVSAGVGFALAGLAGRSGLGPLAGPFLGHVVLAFQSCLPGLGRLCPEALSIHATRRMCVLCVAKSIVQPSSCGVPGRRPAAGAA